MSKVSKKIGIVLPITHFDHFIYFIILSRVRQLQHLRGSSLPNIWWFHPSLSGSLHLRPYSGPQPAELPVAPGGEGEEHQTWGEQEGVIPGSDVYRRLRCQCSLPAEEDHPGQFVFVWWKRHLFFLSSKKYRLQSYCISSRSMGSVLHLLSVQLMVWPSRWTPGRSSSPLTLD